MSGPAMSGKQRKTKVDYFIHEKAVNSLIPKIISFRERVRIRQDEGLLPGSSLSSQIPKTDPALSACGDFALRSRHS